MVGQGVITGADRLGPALILRNLEATTGGPKDRLLSAAGAKEGPTPLDISTGKGAVKASAAIGYLNLCGDRRDDRRP